MDSFENCELLKQGAEGRIFKTIYLDKPCVIKQRFQKKYRHPDLDQQITKERIRAEAKAIVRCRSFGIRTPTLYHIDMSQRAIYMEYFENSITAKEFIFNACDDLIKKLSIEVGRLLAIMHSNKMVHGDLTTSNILVITTSESFYSDFNELTIALIDFGLAQLEASAEDKGVDLYVLERALLSTHSAADEIFPTILDSYKNHYKNNKDVIRKFEEVSARGRKRTMVG